MAGPLLSIVLAALAVAAGVLLLIFVAVPLLKGIGWMIGGFFRGLGWLIAHLFEFVTGMIGDTLRFVGSIIATLVFMPLVVLNVVIGRWSAAGHFTESVKREWKVGFLCLYRVLLRRPLKLCLLHGLLEGVEERVPEAMAASPTRDKPSKRTGKFQGYTIVGSLRGGGSGAKLYIAQPDESVRARYPGMPDRVVIKSFALAEGSSLPQIVRESRALECAKQLGLVFEHGMDEHRFYYVMPYHAGDHLGIVARQLHAESGERGLGRRQLNEAMAYTSDLVHTLSVYHQGGLWHKDVKPENVIIHDGHAHLVDLGLVTPLRSAMTLTTHGTEYFRDPEMVRMALRGVKVHQVNGAKFDIFAIGAVLYFVVENDFPAHGALSRFTKQSPDALKWIVRRSMADYSHRYESADAMLADLRHLSAASDPYAVKPAELPSMLGHGDELADLADEAPEVQQFADVAAPPEAMTPEAMPPAGAAVASVTPAAYTPRPVPVPTPTQSPASKRRRPRIEVTNWWTGQYRVQDVGAAGPAGGAPENPMRQHVEFARQQAARLRHEAAALRRKVETGRMSPHRAARDQVRAARARAKEIRQRTHVRRSPHSRGPSERHPSMAMLFVTLLVILPLAGLAMILFAVNRRATPTIVTMEVEGQTFVIPGDGIPFALQMSNEDGPPLLLVPQLDVEQMTESEADLTEIILRNEQKGYNVLMSQALLGTELPALVKSWQDDPADEAVDEALEDLLELHGLYGLLVIAASDDEENPALHESMIKSTRRGADRRRASMVMLPPAPQPFILVNDHPTKSRPRVESMVNYRIEQLRSRGWTIVDDNLDLEAAILKAGLEDPSSPRLQAVLQAAQLGGIVHVYAPSGEAPANERIAVTVILTDDEPVSIEVSEELPEELPVEEPPSL